MDETNGEEFHSILIIITHFEKALSQVEHPPLSPSLTAHKSELSELINHFEVAGIKPDCSSRSRLEL